MLRLSFAGNGLPGPDQRCNDLSDFFDGLNQPKDCRKYGHDIPSPRQDTPVGIGFRKLALDCFDFCKALDLLFN